LIPVEISVQKRKLVGRFKRFEGLVLAPYVLIDKQSRNIILDSDTLRGFRDHGHFDIGQLAIIKADGDVETDTTVDKAVGGRLVCSDGDDGKLAFQEGGDAIRFADCTGRRRCRRLRHRVLSLFVQGAVFKQRIVGTKLCCNPRSGLCGVLADIDVSEYAHISSLKRRWGVSKYIKA
jgi:hypothetical protein